MNREVLVADDTEDMRELLRFLLVAGGWQVTAEVADGVSALARWTETPERFAALVLDHKMPGMTGIDVARAVRKEGSDVPILLVSAYLESTLCDEAATLDVICLDKLQATAIVDHLPR